jgi:rubrerythrin
MHGPDPSWCARLHGGGTQRPSSRASSDDENRGVSPVAAGETERFGHHPNASPDSSAGESPGAHRPSPFVYREVPSVHECEICGTVMYDHNCKIVCPNCGYKRDCSDP